MSLKAKIVYLDQQYKTYSQKIKILTKNSNLSFIDEQKAVTYYQKLKCQTITIYCPDYPNELKLLSNPPLVLYYLGNINLLKKSKISIIGSRKCTSYAKQALNLLIPKMKHKVTVSGFAYGVDQYVHQISLQNKIPTIAVLGGGFNDIYPKNNLRLYQNIQKFGLVISEYSPNSKPAPWKFVMRNRIIAALNEKLLVIEATPKSGSLITVEVALEIDKQIYALPGNIFSKQSEGTNLLIEEGAEILTKDTNF